MSFIMNRNLKLHVVYYRQVIHTTSFYQPVFSFPSVLSIYQSTGEVEVRENRPKKSLRIQKNELSTNNGSRGCTAKLHELSFPVLQLLLGTAPNPINSLFCASKFRILPNSWTNFLVTFVLLSPFRVGFWAFSFVLLNFGSLLVMGYSRIGFSLLFQLMALPGKTEKLIELILEKFCKFLLWFRFFFFFFW